MVETGHPVEIAQPLSSVISRVVGVFAEKEASGDAVHWYHDQPIWFVKKREGNVVRRVQIAAFRVKRNSITSVTIKLIPDAYVVEAGRSVRHSEPELIRHQIQTVDVYSTDDRPIPLDVFEKDLFSLCTKHGKLTLLVNVAIIPQNVEKHSH